MIIKDSIKKITYMFCLLMIFTTFAHSFEVKDARITKRKIYVELSDPVNQSSITEDSLFILNDKGKIKREIKISRDGKTLNISIKKNDSHRPFILVMTPSLLDTDGNGLSKGFIKVFNVLIHPLWSGKKDWLIKVSDDPHIEIEDIRRWIFSGSDSDKHPGKKKKHKQKRFNDEDLTKMKLEEIVELCLKKPPKVKWKNVSPAITISGISDGQHTNKDVRIDIKVKDKKLFFSYNFLNLDLYESGSLIINENSYWLFVIAVDKGLKFSYEFLRFVIDKTPPEFLSLTPSEDFETNKPELTIAGEVKGADRLTINGQEIPLENGKFQSDKIALQVGANRLTVLASDRAGNTAQRSFTATYVPDVDPPEITINSPQDGSYTNIPAIAVSGTVTDESEITKVTVNGNLATLQDSEFLYEDLPLDEGSNEIVVEAEDEFANKSSLSISVSLDTIKPQLSIDSPSPDSFLKEKSVLIQGQIQDSSPIEVKVNDDAVEVEEGAFSITLELEEGKNEITARATDKAGNKNSVSLNVTIDTIPPVIKVISPLENEILPTPSIPINGKIEDENPYKIRINENEGVVLGTSFYYEDFFLQEGQNEVVLEAEDRAGNTSQKSFLVIMDSTPPEISITSPLPNMLITQKSIPVRGNVSDASGVEVKVNEIQAEVVDQEFTVLAPLTEGLNIIKAEATDGAGNKNLTTTTVSVDTIAPVINMISPENNDIFNTSPVPVTGRVVEENLLAVKVNGQDVSLESKEFTSSVELTEGENRIEISAEDKTARQTSLELTVFLDTTAPEITSVIPTENASNIPIQVSIEAEFSETIDSSTLNQDTFSVTNSNGEKIEGIITFSEKKAIFTPSSPLPDSQTLYIDLTSGIKDLAGNALSNPYHGGFATEDTSAPQPPVLDPLPERTGLTTITVSGTTDPLIRIEIEGGAVKTEGKADENGKFSIEVSLIQNTLNQLFVTVTDSSGNQSLPSSASLYQDASAFEVVTAEFFNNQVTVSFSKPVDPQTLTNETFYLLSQSGKEEGIISTASGDYQAVLNPTQDLSETPFLLTVTTATRDKEGNSLSFEFSKMFNQVEGESFIQGEVYSDFTGLPLQGAVVKIINVNGEPTSEPVPTTVTSKQGKYALACPSGKIVIQISREGYTTCERIIVVSSGFSSELLDSRISPLNTQSFTVSPEGGTVFIPNPEIKLIYPEGAVDDSTQVKITPVSAQALRERLPYGWSPLAAVDISPAEIMLKSPCTLRVKNDYSLSPEQKLAFARWDEVNFKWMALSPPSISAQYLDGSIEQSGQYVFLIPDSAPVAPPDTIPGEALPSVQPPPIPDIEEAQLTFIPDEIHPDERSLGSLIIRPVTPISSGTPVQAVVNENYELLTGTQTTFPAYTADLASYNYATPDSKVEFYLSPNLEISVSNLKIGYIDTDLRKYLISEMGVLIGPEGGTVTGGGGAEITIEEGSVENYIPVSIKAGDANLLSLSSPSGFKLLGVVELSLGGYSLEKQATVSLPLTQDVIDSLGSDPQLIASKLQKIDEDYSWLIVQTSKIDTSKVITHSSTEAFLPLPGVTQGGTYVFLAALYPVGYMQGTVSDQGQALKNALLTVDNHTLRSFSQATGSYGQLSFLGSFEITALNRVSKDQGSSSETISSEGEIKTLDITISPVGPEIISITPADGAVDVPLETKVEVLFSEPIKASTFHSDSFYLGHGTTKAEGVYKLSSDGRRGEFTPSSALPSDTEIAVALTTGIQDLASNPMASVFSSTFHTKDVVPPETDPDLITVVIPENGYSKIIGQAGSVEPGATVIIINDETGETVTVSGSTDGSFDTQIKASIGDKIIIKIIDSSDNEIVIDPGPFKSEDRKSAVMSTEAAEFINTEGIGIKIEEGTFSAPVVVRIEEETNLQNLAPVPQKFERLKPIKVDFSGIVPNKPFKLSIPAPPNITPDNQIFIAREVFVFGERKLMVVETASLKNGRLEVNSPPWPGLDRPGTYTYLFAKMLLAILTGEVYMIPFVLTAQDLAFIGDSYTGSRFTIPVGVDEEFTLTIRALDTGETIFEGTKTGPPSAGEIYKLHENLSQDIQSPMLLSGEPSGVLCFELSSLFTQTQGITIQAPDSDGDGLPDQGGTVNLKGDMYAADEYGFVRVYNLTTGDSQEEKAGEDGSFDIDITASFKDKILITVQKGNVPLNQEILFVFSEPLLPESVSDKTVKLKEIQGTAEYEITGEATRLPSSTEISFMPHTGLREDTVYTLELSGVKDLAGNSIPEIKTSFRTKKSTSLDFVESEYVSDSLLTGNLLILASASEGIKIIDVSDPSYMKTLSNFYLSRARGTAMEDLPTLQMDSQGRLIVVGGGKPGGGYIKIIDISDPVNPVQVGTQRITERVGYASSYYDVGLTPPATTLPEGYPRRVRTLSNYAFVGTIAAGFEIIDVDKIEEQTSTEPGIILAIYQDTPNVPDLRVFQDEDSQRVYAVCCVYGIWKGVKMFDVTNPGDIKQVGILQLSSTPQKIEIALDYPIDLDNDGEISQSEKRDLAFISLPGDEKIMVLDISDKYPTELGEIQTPGAPGAMVTDKKDGVLYAHAGENLLLIDMRKVPGFELQDENSDGIDDRIMGMVRTKSGTCHALSIDHDLKIAYVGQFQQGVESVKLGPPTIEIVSDIDKNGIFEPLDQVAPFGIEAQDNPMGLPNEIYLTAFIPGGAGDQVLANVWSVNYEGEPLPEWGDIKPYLDNVILYRQSPDPKSRKYNFFVSEPIQVTIDPESTYVGKKILSGDYIRAYLAPELSELFKDEKYVTKQELIHNYDSVKSVRVELIDSEKPQPVNNPSTGLGEIGGTVYLHSGEFALEEVDLRIPGRGFDFEFRRKHESQSIYSGPLGWNWDHNYNMRLLELPNSDLLFFDGTGRRERYKAKKNNQGIILDYISPRGYFTECFRRQDGSITIKDERGTVFVFNALGRLVQIMDRNFNKMHFYYDLSGKLSTVMDTMGRLISFEYYPYQKGDIKSCRLKSITDFSGRKFTYTYDDENGDLEEVDFEGRVKKYGYVKEDDLKKGHNLLSITNPNDQTYLQNTYDEDKITLQKYGDASISISAGQTASTTDGKGNPRQYVHKDDGHPTSITEGGYTTSYEYNDDGLIKSIAYPMGNRVEYEYDSGNKQRRSQANFLNIIETPDAIRGAEEPQRVTEFKYDNYTNQLVWVSSPNGLTVDHVLDDKGQGNIKEVITNIPGISYSYTYNKYGQITSETGPSGTTNYTYYPEVSPGGTSSSIGGRALDSDEGGYLKDVSTPLTFENYQYDSMGNITQLTNSQGIKASYIVNNFNLVAQEEITALASFSPLAIVASYGYDDNGNVESINETWGSEEGASTNSYSFTYNTRNNLLSATELNRGPTSYQYDKNENLTVITNQEGRSVSFTYNPRNLIASFKRGNIPEHKPYNFKYDGNKNLITLIDQKENTTNLTYDGYDSPRGTIDHLGNETIISRSESENMVTVKRFDSAKKLIREAVTVNDPIGRVTARIEKLLDDEGKAIDEIVYQYKYTEGGRVTTIVDPLGRESKIIKNDFGWVIKDIDAAGNEIEYHYEDGRGNMTKKVEKEKRADGEFDEYVTEYKYNSFNKVEKVKDPLGNTWTFTYDQRGNLAGSLDPEGNKITHTYDEFGRRLITEKHLLNGEKVVTEFSYDNANNITSIKDANGNITSYTYDELNRLVRVTYPDNTSIQYSYDFNSNIITEKQRNGTLVMNTYDELNRLVARNITRASGVTGTTQETYEYDALSRLIKAEDDDSMVEFKYDSLYRLIEEAQNGKAIRYTFDKVNNRTSIQYTNQRIIDREFDLLNRIVKVKQANDTIADFTYIGKEFRALNKLYGNGDAAMNLYDMGRRLTEREVKNKNAEVIAHYVYGYNRVNMKTFEQRIHDGGKGDVFGYDEMYHLNNVKFNSPEPQNSGTSLFEKSKIYAFDKVDNILKIVETQNEQAKQVLTQVNNLNQYVKFETTSLSYDSNGNLAQKEDQKFTYDYRNQLVSAETGFQTINFKYDALGRRIEKNINGTNPVIYYYDGFQVIEERNGFDQVQKQYTYGNGLDEILRMDNYDGAIATPYYYHTNAIGSVTEITNNEGKIVERVTYDEYGKPTFIDCFTDPQNPTESTNSVIGNSYLFQGRLYDPETNLYYYRARYFHPELGRFLQPDPKGYVDSMNLYQSFGQNGVNFIDPMGKKLIIAGGDRYQLGEILFLLYGIIGDIGIHSILRLEKYEKPIHISDSGAAYTLPGPDLSDIGAMVVSLETDLPIDKNVNMGLWLVNELIKSEKEYLLGTGEEYPSAESLFTGFGEYRNTVGQLVNLDWKKDTRFKAEKSLKNLPPVTVDSVVWFFRDSNPIRSQRNDIYTQQFQGRIYYKDNREKRLEYLYLVVFHELMEAYLKVDENKQYSDIEIVPGLIEIMGAHNLAIEEYESELRWQRRKYLLQGVSAGRLVLGLPRWQSPLLKR